MGPTILSCDIERFSSREHSPQNISYAFHFGVHASRELMGGGRLRTNDKLGVHMGVLASPEGASTYLVFTTAPASPELEHAAWMADHTDTLYNILDKGGGGRWFLTPGITSASWQPRKTTQTTNATHSLRMGRQRTSRLFGRVGDPLTTGAWLYGRLRNRTTDVILLVSSEDESRIAIAVRT